jgi:hypothetical protein
VFDAPTALKFQRFLATLVLIATSFSAFLTSAKFSAGDRLLVCWLLFGAGYLLSAVRHSVRLYSYVDSSVALPPIVGTILVILQNVFVPVALLLFVLAWRATGLTAPMSRTAQMASIAAGVVVAVLVGGFPLVTALSEKTFNSTLLASTAGDIVGLSFIVPLALPALAMRGGVLMHTWIDLAASQVAWLFFDLAWALWPNNSTPLEVFRVMALLFALIATIAQRRAMSA